MKSKIIAFNIIFALMITMLSSTNLAVITIDGKQGEVTVKTKEDVTLQEVENNICKIQIEDDGELIKKLINIDDKKKEATLQIDVINSKKIKEDTIPIEIMLVIDDSGSMRKNEAADGKTRRDIVFEAAKELTNKILTNQNNTKIGVVSFSKQGDNSTAGSLDDAKLQIAPTTSKTSIINAIDEIGEKGELTNIDAGLQTAKAAFSSADVRKYIILLTDGVPNVTVGNAMEYSGTTKTKTIQTLNNIKSSGIELITVMTGVNASYQPDPEGIAFKEAKGKTYKDLAEEIFGPIENPNYGKFYYVTDGQATNTITQDVYSDVKIVITNEIKNIVVKDYFPKEILENYDFELIKQANVGKVSTEVDMKDNSITWIIETLAAGETATIQYKLKLKDDFDNQIIDKVMPTNENVEITYIGTNGDEGESSSQVSPKIVLISEEEPVPEEPEQPKPEKKKEEKILDNTVAIKPIPQTGARIVIEAIMFIIVLSAVVFSGYKYLKINKQYYN